MSNQFSHHSQPFVTDKEFQGMSLDEIKYILAQEKEELKKDYTELQKRTRLIREYKRVMKLREKVKKGVDIKKEYKSKTHAKDLKKTSSGGPTKQLKSFDEYFEECIKNREIPKDTPLYLRKALERAMYEYEQGLEREKSALEGFVNKYVIQGIPGLSPEQFYERINKTLRDFFTYHRNIKSRLVLVCIMEKQNIQQNVGVVGLEEDKAYFHSFTLTNFKTTNVDELIGYAWDGIEGNMELYQERGSA